MVAAPPFSRAPGSVLEAGCVRVHRFDPPLDARETALVEGFAEEWRRFPAMSEEDLRTAGGELFDRWPFATDAGRLRVLDVGCGSGRWSRFLAGHVGHIDALDPGEAVVHAARANADLPNVRWTMARAEDLPFGDGVFDAALCLGVLHHIADPGQALAEIARVTKPGGMLYFYVYYALEQRGAAYRLLYRASDAVRRVVSRSPKPVRRLVSEAIAATVYLGLVGLVRVWRSTGMRGWERLPLAYYHNKSFRVMRNDALDRFGTALERRYDRAGIQDLLHHAGFGDVRFSPHAPYWHGTAVRM